MECRKALGRKASHDDLRAAILLTAGLALARLVALFRTPLELYPDEAQYWLWSRTLDFGYYSKPPVIAWAIWATTALGGDAEPWVRLSANLFQAGATFVVFLIGRRLYGAATGPGGGGALRPDARRAALGPGGRHRRAAAVLPVPDDPGLCAPAGGAEPRRGRWWPRGWARRWGWRSCRSTRRSISLLGLAVHLAVSRPRAAAWTRAGRRRRARRLRRGPGAQPGLERRARLRHPAAHRRERRLERGPAVQPGEPRATSWARSSGCSGRSRWAS